MPVQLPSEKVMAAVEKAGYRVTYMDVAATAGIDVDVAQKDIVSLASLTQANLEVSKDGDIVYAFPRDFRAVLRNQSVFQQARELYNKVQPALYYLVRVGFGAMLLASLFVIFSSIMVIMSSSSSDNDNKDRDRGRSGGMSMGRLAYYFGPSPFDLFYYRPYYGYYYDDYSGRKRNPEEMGFLEAIFSYIFGDGDPNVGFDEDRMKLIAQVIRANGGAVVAEQLAPYLDVPLPNEISTTNLVQENYMLPVLSTFNGRPEVTAEGSIIYTFPEMQTSAVESIDPALAEIDSKSSTELSQLLMERGIYCSDIFEKKELKERLQQWAKAMTNKRQALLPPFAKEKTIPFSVAGKVQLFFAGLLGAINLAGAGYLGFLLANITGTLPGWLGIVQALYLPLLAYAISFNVVPLVRFLNLKGKNAKIDERNRARETFAGSLVKSGAALKRKLEAAKQFSFKTKVITKKDITYTTGKDILEQTEASPVLDDLAKFDKRLKG